jgi:DNA adenine methylase
MSKIISLKTPISYYGGKQNMLRHILPKIPQHQSYIEPFFGGGAVFWAKDPSPFEVVNDISNRLMTFYKVLKYDFEEIEKLVDETFHSRAQHRESDQLYISQKSEVTRQIECAWSVWVQSNMSFGTMIGGGFGYDRSGKSAVRIFNKKNRFTQEYQSRLKTVTIESYDVLKVIRAYDGLDSFFYLDPPYVSSDQGPYKGYKIEDFVALLEACKSMQGKFLLSSYPEEILMEYRDSLGWKFEDHTKTLAVDGRRKATRTKVECLTWNW